MSYSQGLDMNNLTTNTTTTKMLSPAVLTSLGVFLIVSSVVGTLANGSALYVFFSQKHLRSPTNTFIIGLLCCDFLMCTVGAPLPAASNLARRWLWGWSGCVFHAFSTFVLGLSNMNILAAIAVDRYIIIAKPFHGARINFRVVGISLALCYFFGCLWSMMPFFGWSSFAYEGCGTSCAILFDYYDSSAFSYNIFICITCFIIPVSVMLYCYYYVFMTIRSMSKGTAFDKKSRIAKRNARIEKKMAKTIAVMIGVFLFAWTPYALTAFWVAFGFGTLPLMVATIPSMFAKSASVWNPIVYVYTNKEFRKAFYNTIPWSCLRTKLQNQENDKDADSDESDITEKDKNKSIQAATLEVKFTKRAGVAPINNENDTRGVTIVEDLTLTGGSERRDDGEEIKVLSETN